VVESHVEKRGFASSLCPLERFRAIGVEHIALQFMMPHWPERQAQIERFARAVMPEFQRQ